MNFEGDPQFAICQTKGLMRVFKEELLWVMYRLCEGPYIQTHTDGHWQVSKCIRKFPVYTQSRLVSVTQISLDSSGPRLTH